MPLLPSTALATEDGVDNEEEAEEDSEAKGSASAECSAAAERGAVLFASRWSSAARDRTLKAAAAARKSRSDSAAWRR